MELFGYRKVVVPIPIDFWHLNRKEARAYFKWFIENIPVRLNELERALACNEGRDVSLDFTRESLRPLGNWFQKWVEIRSLTPEEMQREKDNTPPHLHCILKDWALTEQTLSLCFDIAIYVGETFRLLHPEVHWEPRLTGRTSVDFNQPLLVPFPNKMNLNPLRIVRIVALKVVDGISAADALPEVFLIWEDVLRGIVPKLPSEQTDFGEEL